jgi:hypothetical protein
LLFHLSPSGFCFAQVAEAHGESVDFRGNGAEVIVGSPLDTVLEVSAADLLGGESGTAQRQDERSNGEGSDDECSQDGEAAESDESCSKGVFASVEAMHHGVASRLDLLYGVAPLLFNSDNLLVAQIFDAHIGDGLSANDFFVFLQQGLELESGVEAVDASGRFEQQILSGMRLLFEAEECFFALRSGFSREDVFFGERGLGCFHSGDGVLRDAYMGFEGGDFEEGVTHQEADGCHEDNQQDAARNQPFIQAHDWNESPSRYSNFKGDCSECPYCNRVRDEDFVVEGRESSFMVAVEHV